MHKRRPAASSAAAFTLAEMIIAMVIFATVSISSIAYFGAARDSGEVAKRHLYGLQLAEELIEKARSRDFYNAGTGMPPTPQNISVYNTNFVREYSNSLYQASIYESATEEYRVIQVTVTWQTDTGATKIIQLNTVIGP